ncbi:MAG: amidophosphoribosyltransferase [Thaumarchaeota archaeon]|nr:amidophosphoribosyltransferase [Nitrososphaerota archaeon]
MPGIFGVYPFGEGRENWNASRFLYFGLSALQGRGQEIASIALFDAGKKSFSVITEKGLVDDLFRNGRKFPASFLGLGLVSAFEDDSIIEVKSPTKLVLAGDGKPLLHKEKAKAFRNLAETLSEKLAENKDSIRAVTEMLSEVKGGFSFIAIVENQEMICVRDKMGVKPLEVGAVGFDLGVVASETCALDVIGAGHTGSIKPAEVIVLDPLSIRRKITPSSKKSQCSFEFVYLARPDSYIGSVSVYEVRERIGETLATESPARGDVIVGVPETALPFAVAYSRATKIPNKLGFTRTGRHMRTALKPTQFERISGVQLKLNPIRSAIEKKETILIDDSIVRGNTLKNTVLNMKRKGAKKVHVRVGSPALVSECPYGVDVPPKDELIGRNVSGKEIAQIIGADSFAYLSTEGLAKAIGLTSKELCMGCFTGKYPEKVQ